MTIELVVVCTWYNICFGPRIFAGHWVCAGYRGEYHFLVPVVRVHSKHSSAAAAAVCVPQVSPLVVVFLLLSAAQRSSGYHTSISRGHRRCVVRSPLPVCMMGFIFFAHIYRLSAFPPHSSTAVRTIASAIPPRCGTATMRGAACCMWHWISRRHLKLLGV